MVSVLHNSIYQLFDIDIKSLILILFWGNLVSAGLIFSFRVATVFSRHDERSLLFMLGKLFQGAAFGLLLLRGQIPDLLSVNCGNTSLFLGVYFEALAMLNSLHAGSQAARRLCTGITAVCILIFNIAEYTTPGNPSLRVVTASLCVFFTLCVPTERLFREAGGSKFRHVVGGFYLVFLAMLLPRAVLGATAGIGLFTGAFIQSLTYLSLVLLLVFNLAAYLLLLKEESDKALHNLATMDILTGLPNRRAFRGAARQLFKQHMRDQRPLAVIAFDLDDLKTVNNVLGHNFGDLVLKHFAKALQNVIRDSGILCRYGSGEFLVLITGADAGKAASVGKDIMQSVKKIFMDLNTGFIFTASGGFTASVPASGDTLEIYIQRAEQALYLAKTTGKNKIMEWIVA